MGLHGVGIMLTPDQHLDETLKTAGYALAPVIEAIRVEVAADVCQSYILAMKEAGIPHETLIHIQLTVDDYIINHYGEG